MIGRIVSSFVIFCLSTFHETSFDFMIICMIKLSVFVIIWAEFINLHPKNVIDRQARAMWALSDPSGPA